MEVQFYYISPQGTKNKDRIKERSNYRGSNYGDSTVVKNRLKLFQVNLLILIAFLIMKAQCGLITPYNLFVLQQNCVQCFNTRCLSTRSGSVQLRVLHSYDLSFKASHLLVALHNLQVWGQSLARYLQLLRRSSVNIFMAQE